MADRSVSNSDQCFRLVIPTRNSEAWVGVFLDAYRRKGVEPLYLLDRRSSDKTAEILAGKGADAVLVTPTEDRVESMLAQIPGIVEHEWVLRLDDDEFPSRALLEWLDDSLGTVEAACAAISRREAIMLDKNLVYSRLEDFYWFPGDYSYLNPQWRLFRPRSVRYCNDIHTPGFVRENFALIPAAKFFVHFDCIVRSYDSRLEKLRGYEQQMVGGGFPFARLYLLELHQPRDLRPTPFETTEFDRLAVTLADY